MPMAWKALGTQYPLRILTRLKSTKLHGAVIGIDLGTTNSLVAIMEGKVPRIIENAEGSRITPSVVAFTKDSKCLVGTLAKYQSIINSENTVFASKRLIGRRFEDIEVQRYIGEVPFKIIKHSNGDAWVEIRGRTYSPAQIVSFILNKMKENADAYLNKNIKNAVVAVPAYFNNAQIQATKDAGQIIGLNVLGVVNEPTAAALAYGLDKSMSKFVAVFDLGGGTFDISILDVDNGVFGFKCTNGDTHLGGEDFDTCLSNEIVSRFKAETSISLDNDRMAIQRIKEAAEKAKIELSSTSLTEINLPFITADATGPKHIKFTLSRAQLENLTAPLIDRTINLVRKALKDAKLNTSDISDVLLVGGMSRMPKVAETLQKLFGGNVSIAINPDEAVALGAAIQGAILSGEVSGVLSDVTPLSLGIETLGGVFTKLIPRKSTIPTKKSQIFSTAASDQTTVEVRVFQGERELVKDNKLIGNFTLTEMSPAPKGISKIKVTFDIDASGMVNVSAEDLVHDKYTSITVAGAPKLSEAEIKRMVDEAETHKGQDQARRSTIQTVNKADQLVNDTENFIKVFEGKLNKTASQVLKDQISSLRELISRVQAGDEVNDKDLSARIEKLQTSSMKFSKQLYKNDDNPTCNRRESN